MPRRTNEFQRIVTQIAKQLAPLGAIVRESVELEEIDTGVRREVDTLIEVPGGFAPLRVAVECRDRGRKDDITWVDGLIGKYAKLPVAQVIAFSRSGFTETAKRKAAANRIELLSVREGTEVDWQNRFLKLGLATLAHNYQLVEIILKTEPTIEGELTLDAMLTAESGATGTLQQAIEEAQPYVVGCVREYLRENLLNVYRTLADLEKNAVIHVPWPVKQGGTLSLGNRRYKVLEFIFIVFARSKREILDVKRQIFGEKAAVTSTLLTNDDKSQVKLSTVQVPGVNAGSLIVEPVKNPAVARSNRKGKPRKRKPR